MSWSGRNDRGEPVAGHMTDTERIGALGGTFDPPHNGHLALARAVLDALSLTRLLVIPAADPPHKRGQAKTSVQHRVAMLQRALADKPEFQLCRLDVDRPGPHFTVDSMRLLRARYPHAALWFVMGADSLRDLPHWHRPQELTAQCRLAVVPRPGVCAAPDMHHAVLPDLAQRVDMVKCGPFPSASSAIAAALRRGEDVRDQVPGAVLAYIDAHGLYRPC